MKAVRQALEQIIAAYEGKDDSRFTELVSLRYRGEPCTLDMAVRRGFSTCHNLTLSYTVTKAFVAITFTRGWTEIGNSEIRTETGETSLVFVRENGNYKLFSQSRPLLFGLD